MVVRETCTFPDVKPVENQLGMGILEPHLVADDAALGALGGGLQLGAQLRVRQPQAVQRIAAGVVLRLDDGVAALVGEPPQQRDAEE